MTGSDENNEIRGLDGSDRLYGDGADVLIGGNVSDLNLEAHVAE